MTPLILAAGGLWIYFALVSRVGKYVQIADTLPDELAAARKEGLPLTPSDLRPNPPVPATQNAAPLYRQITTLVNARPRADGEAFSGYLKGPRDAASTARVKTLLQAWSTPLALAGKAAERPHCDFNRPWEQGPEMLFPELPTMRGVVRALAARAVIENAEGHPIRALDTVKTVAMMSHHSGSDPGVVCMLVRIALQAIGDRPFREVVCAHLDDPSVLAKARSVLREFDPPADLVHAYRGEVVVGRACMDIVRNEPNEIEEFFHIKRENGGFRREQADASEAKLISYWRSVYAALRETKADGVARSQRIKALAAEMDRHENEPGYELAVVLVPVFTDAQDKVLGNMGKQRLRKGLLRLAEFHRQNHRFPTTAEAAALIPLDPFTEHTLIYRPQANSFILYSVGENFKDDGGTEKRPKKGDPTLDIVIQYPLPIRNGS